MKALSPTGLLALALLFAASPALADGAERIRKIEEDIDQARFEEAETDLRAALESGELSATELARVHLSSGVIAAARRDSETALAGFRRALSLDPEVTLPRSAGPHVAELFEQARAAAGRLDVVASGAQPAPGEAARIDVRVAGDPEKLARKLRLASGSFRAERALPPRAHALEVPAPARGCSDVSAELVDAHGNRVWSSAAITRVCAAEAAPPDSAIEPPPTADRPIGAPVWVGITATGVGFAVTSVLGLVALDRRSEYHNANSDPARTESERRALRDDASAAASTATIAAIATGVIGAATVTLYLLRPERAGTTAGVSAGPGGARAVVGVRF